ncbi:MAG: apolipoprotein N-acyltransferase [Gammaproteobacteria bacterium]|nr:apolipoprotein N-acyltransferase [Gammaproteobacteria bacterium]
MSRAILLLFAGAISVLAFSPFHLWWVSIISLSLLYLLHQQNHSQAFKTGYLFGIGMFGSGISWIFNSLYDFGEAPFIAAIVITIVYTLVLSIFPALVLKVHTRLSASISLWMSVLTFAALWVMFEWLRSWVLTGFPWLLVGHSLVDSPLAGIIPIFGTFAGSALIAFLAASTIVFINASKQQLMWPAIGLSVLLMMCFYATGIEWTSKVGERPVKVSAVQANIPFDMKWDKSRRHEVYQAYIDLTSKHLDSDIVLWPETAIPTFLRVANKDFIPSFERQLKDNNTELLSGVFTYEPGTERIFNSLVTLGGELQIYNKHHLVPFGEYLPLRWIFEFFRSIVVIPMSDLSPGQGSSVLTLKGIPVGVSICYEAAFGEEINRALPEAQMLMNVTNDAWFGNSLAPHQHLQIARTRALETGRYMLRAANTGVSAVIDSNGQVMAESGQFVDQVITGEVWPMRGSTPFIIWGNWAIISILSALILLVFVRSRRANSGEK